MRALSLICLAMVLQGCVTTRYTPVPLCDITSPPAPTRYNPGEPDVRLVLMTNAYIDQVRAVADCNATIKLVNASNSTK